MKHTYIFKITLPFIFLIFLLPPIAVQTGCANIIPPMGGPRDSLPPELVSVNPPDSTRSFTGRRITFGFNEYVQLDNIQENLLVSPLPKINPTVDSRLRTVTVTIKDTLEENTTYSIDFGNAIKDINEGNVLKNFTYLFTTGNTLDSLQISGKVIIAETGKTDSSLIIMLHTHTDDSAVIKERPRYITRVDGNGNFNFYNLPAATYAIYALKDEGGQRKYLSPTQLFGFSDSLVTTAATPNPVTIYAYTEPDTTATEKPATTARPATGRRPLSQAPDNRLRLETNLTGSELDLLSNFELYFRVAPLKNFDSSKVKLTNDSFELITTYSFIRDTGNQKITLLYKWLPGAGYNIIFEDDFAEDTAGRKLSRADTLSFKAKKESDYGAIRLRLLNLDLAKNPVLQFVQGEQVKFSYVLTGREYITKLFQPGEYDLRILYDDNKNGKWDAGSFFGVHRQPEKAIPLSRKLTVKANWDNEVDITLEGNNK